MEERPLPEAPSNEFVALDSFHAPPADAAPPPPPPQNVFEAPGEAQVEYHEPSHEDQPVDGSFEPSVAPEEVEGVTVMEHEIGGAMEADTIEELPSCMRCAQAAVPGSAYQLYSIQEEQERERATAARQIKQQHSRIDLNKINDGTVLPITASQVLLVKKEAALARRHLSPPNLPESLMEELPAGSIARVTPSYKETKKLVSEHGDSFVDHSFPRKASSNAPPSPESLWEWRSAAKERPDAVFLSKEAIEHTAIVPGKASGRGFLAAVSALSAASRGRSKHLLERVMPSKGSQEYLSKNAEAVRENLNPQSLLFKFSFYKWGQWVDVVVDDRLPAVGTSNGYEFVCARATEANVFGISLLEKAYAKLHGSYAAMQCVSFFDSLRDLTGSMIDISWDMREIHAQASSYRAGDPYYDPEELWSRFEQLHSDDLAIVVTGGVDRPIAAAAGGMEELGLHPHTAYPVRSKETVTLKPTPGVASGTDHIVFLDTKGSQAPLWNGAWSPRSGQWSAVSKGKAKSLSKLSEKYPCGFWVSWKDIIAFSSVLVVLRKERSADCFRGQWLSSCAGGSTAHVSWHRNPQYLLNVKSPGDVVVSLMQQEPILFMSGTGQGGGVCGALRIGFSVFGPIEENRTTKIHNLLNMRRPSLYRNEIEVSECFHAPAAGKYILVVTTWEPEERGKYYLRIQSSPGGCLSSCKELTHDMPSKKTFGGKVQSAIAIRLVSASGLQKRMLHSVHAYAEVTLDGVSKKTKADKDGGKSPFWDERFLFFLRKSSPSKPPLDAQSSAVISKSSCKIKIEVWDSNMLIDTFLGVCHLDVYDMAVAAARDWPGPTKTHSVMLNLEQRKIDKEEGKSVSGSVLFEFCYFLLPQFA